MTEQDVLEYQTYICSRIPVFSHVKWLQGKHFHTGISLFSSDQKISNNYAFIYCLRETYQHCRHVYCRT